jgi:hypothetical protein
MKLFDDTTTEKRFYIPQEVKEKGLLEDHRYRKESKLAYILHQIIYLSTFAPGYWEGDFVPLYSKSLLKILGHRYRKYLDWLIEREIIVEGKKGSTTSHRSNEYALAEKYRDDWTYWWCRDEDLIRRIREYTFEKKNAHLFWKSQPYIHLRRGLEKTEIDVLNANVWIERQDLTEAQKRYYKECVESVRKGTNIVFLNPTNNRVQTPITSMAKELWSFLRLNGCSRLVELDITNSQPFFLALLVAQRAVGAQAGSKARRTGRNTTQEHLCFIPSKQNTQRHGWRLHRRRTPRTHLRAHRREKRAVPKGSEEPMLSGAVLSPDPLPKRKTTVRSRLSRGVQLLRGLQAEAWIQAALHSASADGGGGDGRGLP